MFKIRVFSQWSCQRPERIENIERLSFGTSSGIRPAATKLAQAVATGSTNWIENDRACQDLSSCSINVFVVANLRLVAAVYSNSPRAEELVKGMANRSNGFGCLATRNKSWAGFGP